jgi:hypothetical protein
MHVAMIFPGMEVEKTRFKEATGTSTVLAHTHFQMT